MRARGYTIIQYSKAVGILMNHPKIKTHELTEQVGLNPTASEKIKAMFTKNRKIISLTKTLREKTDNGHPIQG